MPAALAIPDELAYIRRMTESARQRDDREAAALIAAVEEARASVKAGRTVPYERVRRWLLSWGTKGELSKPECP
jgi:predicted transcriptional regulator